MTEYEKMWLKAGYTKEEIKRLKQAEKEQKRKRGYRQRRSRGTNVALAK